MICKRMTHWPRAVNLSCSLVLFTDQTFRLSPISTHRRHQKRREVVIIPRSSVSFINSAFIITALRRDILDTLCLFSSGACSTERRIVHRASFGARYSVFGCVVHNFFSSLSRCWLVWFSVQYHFPGSRRVRDAVSPRVCNGLRELLRTVILRVLCPSRALCLLVTVQIASADHTKIDKTRKSWSALLLLRKFISPCDL